MELVRARRAGVAVEMVIVGCFWALKSASVCLCSGLADLNFSPKAQIKFHLIRLTKNPTPIKIPEKLV